MEIIKEYVERRKQELKELIEKDYKTLKMVIIQVGLNEASSRYVRNKIKDCEGASINCELVSLPETITENELLFEMNKLNNDDSVTGYIVQLPLPKGIDEERVKQFVSKHKDLDGFNPLSKTVAATPLGIYAYLKNQNYNFVGKNAVVIGRSNIVGRPMAKLLLDASCNVTVLHSKTSEADKRTFIENADLIVVATGYRHTLTNEYKYKNSAVIMDVGINFDNNGKLCGDCDKDLPVAFQSPVPGGCGLLTRLSLIDNLIELTK